MPLTSAEIVRYSRHLALHEVGAVGQEKLKAARVLVIGAGGLGSPAALYLAASGVGVLGVVDHDRVDLSNLQRQVLYDSAGVGQPKVERAAERLRALNPQIELVAHDARLSGANVREILSGYDLALDGTDRFATRYLSNDACVLMGKPLVCAAIHRFDGQAMTYVPGRSPCYRCLFPAPPAEAEAPSCAEAGVLGVLPGVMGTIQATEAIKLILGIGEPLTGRLLTYNALAMRFAEFRFSRRSDCAVCGERPTIFAPQDLAETCSRPASAREVRRMTAHELHALLSTAGAVQLVDVRESYEFDAGHLPGAINVPLGGLENALAGLPPAECIVFICRSGARSLAAAALAARFCTSPPAHLEGGLLAWASEVDAAFDVGL